MKKLGLLLVLSLFLNACQKSDNEEDHEQKDPPAETYDVVKIRTQLGDISVWLFEATPLHRENFLALADSGFFNGTTFHRIIDKFMIQGGDPNSKDSDPGNDGYGGPGYTIPAEFVDSLKHDMGMVAAARQGDAVNPDKRSNGSQFYIVENESGAHHLDGAYTIFGKVIGGMDVVHEIAVQPKNSNDRPNQNISMVVTVEQKTAEELETEFGWIVSEE